MSAARSRIIGAIVVVGLSRVLAAQMASPIARPSLPVAAQTSPIELDVPSLTVRFEGGDVPVNASKVLRVLELQNLLETRTATIGKGQSLCDLYRELIGFPMGCTAELVQLANEMNGRNYSKQTLCGHLDRHFHRYLRLTSHRTCVARCTWPRDCLRASERASARSYQAPARHQRHDIFSVRSCCIRRGGIGGGI